MGTKNSAIQESTVPYPGAYLFKRISLEGIEERWGVVSLVLVALCSLSYFFATVQISIQAPLWLDEVMASWMSQLRPAGKIWVALNHGTMSSPPTYFYVLKMVRSVFGGSDLALRLPSILAVYVTGSCAYVIMRRRFSAAISSLAMVLCLETGLFAYATQVREYALVTMCYALAVLVWDTPMRENLRIARAFVIAVLLGGCVALHFYGVLPVAAFGLMEILWSIPNRRIRFDIWAAVVAAAGSVLVWLPLIHNIMRFTKGEAASAKYFAYPTLSRLLTAYADLAIGGKGLTLLCSFLLLTAFLLFWDYIAPAAGTVDNPQQPTADVELNSILLASLAIPAIVFVFALIVTKTFNERYAIAACFGFAMLFARFISNVRRPAVVACILLAASSLLIAAAPRRLSNPDHYGMKAIVDTPDSAPVVVGEGLAFIEMQAAADGGLRNRLVYLTTPAGEVNPDRTNEDLVTHWHEFRQDLRVINPESFVAAHDHFYLLHSDQSTDVITPWLMRTFRLRAVWNIVDDKDHRNVWLFEATSR